MNKRLKVKFLEAQKSQIAVAREVGLPEASLSKIINGWIAPRLEVQEKIAKALKCQVHEIFPAGEKKAGKSTEDF